MSLDTDNRLVTLIRVVPPVAMIVFVIILVATVFQANQRRISAELSTLRSGSLEQQKEVLQAQVDQVIQQADFERQRTETLLKESIQLRVQEAHAIAQNIFEQHSDKPEAEVTKHITDALRTIRFNQGRGYFFIYKTTGDTVMHPVLPQNEGVNKIGLQDIRGAYIVRDMGALVKEQGEAFYRWWFVKPQNKTEEFEKIGFGKYFEPYDWFIGTGEYIVDVEADIQSRLLQQIDSIRFGANGFVFVYNERGDTLSHFNTEWVGSNRLDALDGNGKPYVQELIRTGLLGANFVEFLSPIMPSTGQPAEKLAYVDSIKGWNWVIGTGLYTDELNQTLNERERELLANNTDQIYRIFGIGSAVTLFLFLGSWFLSRRIADQFEKFHQQIVTDFDRLERSKDQMEHMALHDSLTGLPNRTYLNQKIENDIERSRSQKKSLAIMFVDLDDFKKINDVFGHNAGDQLLQKLGMRFYDLVQNHGTVARFGGDEFIFCFPELEDLRDAENCVEAIQDVFSEVFDIGGKFMNTSCSIGVAMFPEDGDTPDELITKSDIVLYKSKAHQKGRVLFYDQAINRQVQYDFELERELRKALIDDELNVVYQPQISANDDELVGVEALVRWNNAQLGEISPNVFIEIAEEIGLIHDIGIFVIERACQDMAAVMKALDEPIHLSINISPKQLLEVGFAEDVTQRVINSGLKPEDVTLEITENVLINDLQQVKPVLESIRKAGFGISLDDFGTGYSSLSYINSLPLTEIKIDRTFVDGFLDSKQSESLILAILAIGNASNMNVVAEGVETEEQKTRLEALGCNWLQGYYFSKPIHHTLLISQFLKTQ